MPGQNIDFIWSLIVKFILAIFKKEKKRSCIVISTVQVSFVPQPIVSYRLDLTEKSIVAWHSL